MRAAHHFWIDLYLEKLPKNFGNKKWLSCCWYYFSILTVWPNLANFANLASLWQHFEGFLLLVKILNLFWQIIRQIFIVANGQILNKLSIHLVSLHPTLSFQQNQFCSSDWPFLGCENDLWVQANSDKKSVKDTTWKCASQRERKWEINLTFNTFNSGTRIGCKADSPKKIIHL